jgi:DNA-binding MarR family transcriptional regulator
MATRSNPGANLGRTVTHRLHALQKLTDRVSQQAYLEKAGMPLGEGRCLAAVGAFSPLSVSDLAARANLDKGQASRAAQALLDQGLVSKEASAIDGRGVVLSLTPEGVQVWRRLMKVIRDRNDEIVACLTPDERETLDALLDRLVEHARAALGESQ